MKKPNVKVWKILESGMFHVRLNANDFFAYACSDCVDLNPCDFKWAFPIIDEFGLDGLYAVMSYVEDCLPIKERRTKEFKVALKKLKKQKPDIFSKISEWSDEQLEEVKKKFKKEGDL